MADPHAGEPPAGDRRSRDRRSRDRLPGDWLPGDWLPGDLPPREQVERIVRVNHAGEYGARRIYEGQLAVLGNSRCGPVIQHMAAQEDRHLRYFEHLIVDRQVRPTALFPLWHVAGFALGAATALVGERAAMACTAAVEEAIDQHYAGQAARLGDDEAGLRDTLLAFRDDEREHRDTALAHAAEQAPGYPVLRGVIKAGSRAAIWLSERF